MNPYYANTSAKRPAAQYQIHDGSNSPHRRGKKTKSPTVKSSPERSQHSFALPAPQSSSFEAGQSGNTESGSPGRPNVSYTNTVTHNTLVQNDPNALNELSRTMAQTVTTEVTKVAQSNAEQFQKVHKIRK